MRGLPGIRVLIAALGTEAQGSFGATEARRRCLYAGGVFEGLLSPWHIVIIVGALFLVLGPEKIAARWRSGSSTIARLVDPAAAPSPEAPTPVEAPPPKKQSLAQRLGRRLSRRRRRR